jgi:hypothetical protein
MKKPTGPATPEEYIAGLDEPRRGELQRLHAAIRKAAPRLEPAVCAGGIGYGMYRYQYASGRTGDWPVIALASRKRYISVYVSASEGGEYIAERNKALLPKANIGRSCIRFKRLSDIDLKALEKVLKEGARVMSKSAASKA